MNIKIDSLIDAANDFYENCKDNNSNLQWEHCYKVFYEARKQQNPDIDSLSLHLAFYLASWGMYRGSSFLRDYDYRVHIPVVEEILKDEWDHLLAISAKDCSDNKNQIEALYKKIYSEYESIRNKNKENTVKSPVSPILITKVLLGTLACVPAYDRFFESGLGVCEIKPKSIQRESLEAILNALEKSLKALSIFYENNELELEDARNGFLINNIKIKYPQMKFLDMGFWQIGKDSKK